VTVASANAMPIRFCPFAEKKAGRSAVKLRDSSTQLDIAPANRTVNLAPLQANAHEKEGDRVRTESGGLGLDSASNAAQAVCTRICSGEGPAAEVQTGGFISDARPKTGRFLTYRDAGTFPSQSISNSGRSICCQMSLTDRRQLSRNGAVLATATPAESRPRRSLNTQAVSPASDLDM